MKDQQFLIWLHERLVNVHNEDSCNDYMHKLRAIIRDMPVAKQSENNHTGNALVPACRLFGSKHIIAGKNTWWDEEMRLQFKILTGYEQVSESVKCWWQKGYLIGKTFIISDFQ